MADQPAAIPPSFGDLLRLGRTYLETLEALEAQVASQTADAHARIANLGDQLATDERELSDFRDARQQWSAERERLAADLARVHQELEDVRRQADDAARTHLEDQRALLAGHEEEIRDLHGRLTGREASLEQARSELQQSQERIEALQAAQLGVAADQQKTVQQLEDQRTLHSAFQVEHRSLKNQLAQAKAELDTMQNYQLQWAAEREEILKDAQTRKEEYEKVSRAHAELIAQASKLNSEASARRQALTTEIQQLNKELNEALSALARQQDRDRQREKAMESLKEGWQREKTELEIAFRDARLAAAGGPVTPERLYALKADLNTIAGFSSLLQHEAANAITPEERLEYLRHIHQSAERFAGELRELAAVGGSEAAPAVPGSHVAAGGSGREAPEVLLADADPETEQRIEPFLSRAGYRLAVAASADEAMERALRQKPIAVVIDQDLPPAGAARLIEDLRRERRTRDVPVLLAATSPDLAVELDGAQVDILSKPIDRQRLLQLLVKLDLLAESARGKKMPATILVVDDDRHHIRLVKATLKPYNVEVQGAESGAEGIKLARELHPDLVILDLMMPGVDGYKVVDALREDASTSDIPIIVYTAKPITDKDRGRLLDKVQSIMEKGDFNRDRLLELIQKRGERRGRGRNPAAA